jgi:RNA polymerase sigma factor (sigma-70 family)
MPTNADDFRTLLRATLAGDSEAAARLCRDYEAPILRVVRRKLMPRLRSRYDSYDFVNDVWASFFANPPRDARLSDPKSLVAYLTRMACNKVAEVGRSSTAAKNDIVRETSLEAAARGGHDVGVPAPGATPSQIVGAEDEFQRLLRGRSPMHQRILTLLRDGMTYREIAARLNTTEKTVQRLVRAHRPEVQLHDRPTV